MSAHRYRVSILVGIILMLPAARAWCEAQAADPAAIQAAIAEAKERLKLTPEQEAQFKPLIEERAAKLKAIREKHAGDESPRAKREIYREARPVADEYQEKVRAILNDEQEAEWERMRAEARERVKERYRAGNGPD